MTSSTYDLALIELFRLHGGAANDEFEFSRDELGQILRTLGEEVRNISDIIYSYRSGRRPLPDEISTTGHWVIEGRGRGRYAFRKLARHLYVSFPEDLQTITILDATPDIVTKYCKDDEQGLLAIVRYNRLVGTFLGITAYHLQSHIRAYVRGSGQVEVDDLYFGVDKRGNRYVVPVEAKMARETLGIVQIAALNAWATQAYPDLILRAIAVKAAGDGSLYFAGFSPHLDCEQLRVLEYRRYRLVSAEDDVS